jgi:glutamate-1-semialdehyde 2,1-aminomutase
VEGLLRNARELGVPATGGNLGSMWGLFLVEGPVRDYADARRSDVALFRRYFHGCLERGVFFAPSAFEAGFLSTEHTEADVDATIERAREALREALV